jgi:hypothetical protein
MMILFFFLYRYGAIWIYAKVRPGVEFYYLSPLSGQRLCV